MFFVLCVVSLIFAEGWLGHFGAACEVGFGVKSFMGSNIKIIRNIWYSKLVHLRLY